MFFYNMPSDHGTCFIPNNYKVLYPFSEKPFVLCVTTPRSSQALQVKGKLLLLFMTISYIVHNVQGSLKIACELLNLVKPTPNLWSISKSCAMLALNMFLNGI
jgi:hypothetical protein